jgi:hypothetical protein
VNRILFAEQRGMSARLLVERAGHPCLATSTLGRARRPSLHHFTDPSIHRSIDPLIHDQK